MEMTPGLVKAPGTMCADLSGEILNSVSATANLSVKRIYLASGEL